MSIFTEVDFDTARFVLKKGSYLYRFASGLTGLRAALPRQEMDSILMSVAVTMDVKTPRLLSSSDIGVICLAGTWLDEEVLFAALEAAKLMLQVDLAPPPV